MAFLSSSPQNSVLKTSKQRGSSKRHRQPSSWDQIKNLLTCKYIQTAAALQNPPKNNTNATLNGAYAKLGHCKYTCGFEDVAHGNTKVIHRPDNLPGKSSSGRETGLLGRKNVSGVSLSSSSRSLAGNASGRSNSFSTSSRRMQFRKLSGCYECHLIVDPSRYFLYYIHSYSTSYLLSFQLLELTFSELYDTFNITKVSESDKYNLWLPRVCRDLYEY